MGTCLHPGKQSYQMAVQSEIFAKKLTFVGTLSAMSYHLWMKTLPLIAHHHVDQLLRKFWRQHH